MNKTLIGAIALSLSLPASGISVTVDLGPPGRSTERVIPDVPVGEIPLRSEPLPLDILFNPGQFVRFTSPHFQDTDFMLFLLFVTDYPGEPGFAGGTGYILSRPGEPLHSPQVLGSATSSDGRLAVALLPLLSGEIEVPMEFMGVHLDLNLPEVEGHKVVRTEFRLANAPFVVGPHVPDSGSTALFLAIGLIAVGIVKQRYHE